MSRKGIPKNFTFENNLSWKEKNNWTLLNRLVNWRAAKFEVFEMQQELEKRTIPFQKSTLKPELAELLRDSVEREMQHLPVHLMCIRQKMIDALDSGRNKDGYNKKALMERLKSRGIKTSGGKRDLVQRLKDFFEAEKNEYTIRNRIFL